MFKSKPIEDRSKCFYIYAGRTSTNTSLIGFTAYRKATEILWWISKGNAIRGGYGEGNDVFWTMVF